MTQRTRIEGSAVSTEPTHDDPGDTADEAHTETARLLEQIIEAIHMPLVVLGDGMRVMTANSSFFHTFEVTPADVEQLCFYDIDDGRWDIPYLRDMLEHVRTQEAPPEALEVTLDFSRIGPKTLLLSGCRIAHEPNAALPILLAIEDVSERRNAERLQQIYVRKLELSNRELQDFAYIASHDLQEPLRAIQAFGERLRMRAADDLSEEARDHLGRMLRAAARMRTLIHDLLEFSRVTTKSRPFETIDLALAAQQAVADLAMRIKETQGQVDVGPLPTLEADATQMRRLLQNLIDNALKYGRDGVPPVVTVSSEVLQEGDILWAEGRDICRMEVRDNGIGFEKKYTERIFAPFQRLHGQGRYDGTGIGLAICRKIVERHGGRIQAQSVPGEGSVFTVTLPLYQPRAE